MLFEKYSEEWTHAEIKYHYARAAFHQSEQLSRSKGGDVNVAPAKNPKKVGDSQGVQQ